MTKCFHTFLKTKVFLRCEEKKLIKLNYLWFFISPKNPKRMLVQKIVQKTLGFTLVELVVTLCVFAILLVIAIPSFRTIILNNRLATSTDLLVADLNYTRGMALNNNANVRICPFSAPNSTTCGADWTSGWIVVTQPAVGTGILLKSQQNDNSGPTINSNLSSITFDSRGLASGQSNFSFCDSRGGTFAHSVEVMTTGFIQSGDTPGQAVWNNSSLNCP